MSYDRSITIETPTTVNTKGDVTTTWSTLCTTWAKRVDESGDAINEQDERTNLQKSKWKMNHVPDLNGSCRFYETYDSSTIYTILNIAHIMRNQIIEIKAETRF